MTLSIIQASAQDTIDLIIIFVNCNSSNCRSSVLDAVNAQMGLSQPILGTLREPGMKGEEAGLWSKNPNIYSPYTTFGLKSLDR